MSLVIRKDDVVMVIAGKERGKTGKVLRVVKEANRAYVEKLNLIKRHSRPSKANPQGGVIQKEAGIHLSNLLLYCNKCSKGVRTGVKVLKNSKKVRVCKKCSEQIDKN